MNRSASLQGLLENCAARSGWPKIHDSQTAERLRENMAWHGGAAAFLAACASGSPYLSRLFTQQTEQLQILMTSFPEQALKQILDETIAVSSVSDIESAKQALRLLKARIAMLLAIADLSGIWTTEQVMEALSNFADKAVETVFSVALKLLFPEDEDFFDSSGIAVFAMGKHGAGELNYSSDIDLVVFYDPEKIESRLEGRALLHRFKTPKQVAVQVTRLAVDILQEQRSDGYVFRTDLRLRPDPGSSAVAVTVNAAENYYEVYGQNWERAAFIKARMVAGDDRVAQDIKAILAPFIWRKYLDYAAIADIHSIKRQIHASKARADIFFAGHDIKIGRGGIREIEFFAQTQQLILGGKTPQLRHRKTLDTLKGLAEAGQISSEAAKELSSAYLFLRHIEHRIQMVNDEQTHTIPKQDSDILRLVRLSGYPNRKSFENDLIKTLKLVHGHYADLFHGEVKLASETGSLVFTGVDHDPDTLVNLRRMGFSEAESVSETIRHWHAGSIRAVRTARARELLTSLVPPILDSITKSDDPDAVFAAFSAFLKNMPAGVQFFSLLQKNLSVLDVIASLVGLSPRLTKQMATRPYFVEALLDEAILHGVKEKNGEQGIDTDDLVRGVAAAKSFEDALNILRRKVKEEQFQVSCHLLLHDMDIHESGHASASIADAAVRVALPAARAEVEQTHGRVQIQKNANAEDGLAVIGMGRLGASALTATSDLDLIFVYECPIDAVSDGTKQLDGITWYTRYVRRLVTALSAQTEEGGLYEIDMALRPSGGAGPAAVSLAAFEKYYQNDAWTWEEMALVKARVVVGEGDLPARLESLIETILTRPRDSEKVKTDVLNMRQRLLKEKSAFGVRDVKRVFGGLTDIDFICQYLSLIHAKQHGRFALHLQDALAAMVKNGAIADKDASALRRAGQDYEAVMQISRAALHGEGHDQTIPDALNQRLASRLGVSSSDQIDNLLREHQRRVSEIFTCLIGVV